MAYGTEVLTGKTQLNNKSTTNDFGNQESDGTGNTIPGPYRSVWVGDIEHCSSAYTCKHLREEETFYLQSVAEVDGRVSSC